MITVKKALYDDFEKIYLLLLEFNNPNLTKADWKQLFVNYCGSGEDYFGYVLLDQNNVVGFLGLIFSNRLVDDKIHKFCNMTSFIIKKEYQGKGFGRLLFSELIKLTDYTIITLPPPLKTLKMHITHGFKELEDSYRLILPIPSISGFLNNCSVLFKSEDLRNNLNTKELKIYNDHLKCKCIHLLIKTKEGNCYIISKRIMRKKMLFAEIHYLSNLFIFLKHIDSIRVNIPLNLKVLGLLIEERFLKGAEIRYSITRKFHRARLFKSLSLSKDKITDNLYTESLILDI